MLVRVYFLVSELKGTADEKCSTETIERISQFLKESASFCKFYVLNGDKYETPTYLHYLCAE